MERKSEKSKRDYDLEDRISVLPDVLLSMIVRQLPVKEAAATSILSKRWNSLEHILKSTTNLDFSDARFVIAKSYYRFLQLQRPEKYQSENYLYSQTYVNSVNHVVEQHSNPTIKRFRTCLIVDPSFAADVCNWIQFAMNKKVEKLELEFYIDSGYTGDHYPMYPFPKKLVSHQSCEYDIGFKFLRVVHFRRVDVTGEVLEYFLSNCEALERLTVNAAHNLVNVRVVGPSISLKHLTLKDCSRLKRIEVRAVKLVSFHLFGMEVENMSLTNVPLLVEVSYSYMVSVKIWRSIELLVSRLSSCISHLEILSLDISGGRYRPNHVIPLLSNLRHLELKFGLHDDVGNFKRFIEACPYLHRLVLKLHKCKRTMDRQKCRKIGSIDKFPRDYLKVVEIVGYRGSHCHDQLASYLVRAAAALEKLVIDPVQRWRDWLDRDVQCSVDWLDRDYGELVEEGQAIEHAKSHLGSIVPWTVEFVCLQES